MLDIHGRKYASVTVCDVTLYDLVTHYPVMYFDTLKLTNLEGTAETTRLQGGRGNRKLAAISHSKEISVQFDDAIMTMSSLALLTGGELREGFNDNKVVLLESELVHINPGDIFMTLSKKARAGSYVYMSEVVDGTLTTATRTEYPISEETQNILFDSFHNIDTTFEKPTLARVFYEYEIGFATRDQEVKEVRVLADKFAGTYKFQGDTVVHNPNTGTYDLFQIEIPRLKLDDTFSLNFNAGGDAAIFSFKGEALSDDEGNMVIFRLLHEEDENTQWDGSHKWVPAKEVTVDRYDKHLTDTGKEYPIDPEANMVQFWTSEDEKLIDSQDKDFMVIESEEEGE